MDTPESAATDAGSSRIRIAYDVGLDYRVDAHGADFVFAVHAARTPQQRVVTETLEVTPAVPWRIDPDPMTATRRLRLRAGPGPLQLRYSATVDLDHVRADPRDLPEVPVDRLPAEILADVLPSRYCQSDRLGRFAIREFGHLPRGGTRVQAIERWVRDHVRFRSNSSNANTSAIDTLVSLEGVCRDFAHLMIALCRALSLPARMVTGTDYGADPALGPPDFHAYVEVFLGDRWYLFDPSGTAVKMGLVRIATGRDAADVAFATMFGNVTGTAPVLCTQALVEEDAPIGRMPTPCNDLLSTCSTFLAPGD